MWIVDTGYRLEGVSRLLSNLYPRPFILDDVACASIEGFLQSLKWVDLEEQTAVATLSGVEAYKTGQLGNQWKDKQILYWRGVQYPRLSRKYHNLLVRAYDACFEQNADFGAALARTGDAVIIHSIGKHNPQNTTLTEWEYVHQLYRLRSRVLQMLRISSEPTG